MRRPYEGDRVFIERRSSSRDTTVFEGPRLTGPGGPHIEPNWNIVLIFQLLLYHTENLTDVRRQLGVEPLLLCVKKASVEVFPASCLRQPGRLPLEVYRARPTGGRPRGLDPELAGGTTYPIWPWEHLRIPQEELETGPVGCLRDPIQVKWKKMDGHNQKVCGLVRLFPTVVLLQAPKADHRI